MRQPTYLVELSEEERAQLETLLRKGKSSARQRFIEKGLEAALSDKPKLNGHQCAHLIAMTCSDAPEGHDHWTLRLLADKAVELGYERLRHYQIVSLRPESDFSPATLAAEGVR